MTVELTTDLTPGQAEAAVLLVEGYTQAEIARVLGITQPSVSARLAHANATLARLGLGRITRPRAHRPGRHARRLAADVPAPR